ncbi:lytic transglycosylase domain-containing protein [Maritimibacter dapengensis]|uniref:Lytic transglycosylase domain-containing protein n=1 Tax=Maritimibacter dapengensis TaxID=2836868 RepID=A0ABS6T4T6_9RHOB|nr:lytic transglycosylase domain-containing protein [Maritimibacter dapengensis]MBV7380195.1 lytic transglycosylase domain-containing protein [Maritimibacter dapengensis]
MRRALTDARLFLAALLTAIVAATSAPAQDEGEVVALKNALDLMRDGKWDAALVAAGPEESLPWDVIQWNRLRASQGSFAETQAFLERRGDWPGIDLLRERSEKTIPEDARRSDVLAFFADVKPETGTGSLRYARALWESGEKDAAMAEARRAWTNFALTSEEEALFMVVWPKTLAEFHWQRMDMLLWRGLESQAERHMARIDTEHQILARARIGLRDDKPGVDGMIEKVPDALADDPGLAYERMLWRARKGRNDDTIELILERSGSAESLGKPDEWGYQRRNLARWAMREGRYETAYDLAANHHIDEGWNREDSEWLAGYLALRFLDRPEDALKHFQTFRTTVDTPISLSRAGYWEGRAHEALGNAEAARAAYAFGGEHQTAFYGLLSAEKAGLPLDPKLAGTEEFPDFRQASFWGTPIMEAARLTWAAGETYLTERMVVHLSERLDRAETGALGDWAMSVDAHHVALVMAKHAVNFEKVLEASYFPVPEIGRGNPTVPRALELSIARRESEFDHEVSSHAGAMGLMQLMPGTAKDMANRVGVDYVRAKLTADKQYNTRLGSEYLAWLMERYGNNPILIAVAYNAGPGRANSWQKTLGDPRDPDVDIVDWIEMIPFNETQTYVMRVTESLPIYEARRAGDVPGGPLNFVSMLKRR